MTADRLDLDALAALEAAATPGDWQIEADGTLLTITQDVEHVREVACALDEPDAALIVALRNAAPALIAAAREGTTWREGMEHHRARADRIDSMLSEEVKRARKTEAGRDAAQAALDATVVTARNRLDEIHRLRAELETAQAALARVTDEATFAAITATLDEEFCDTYDMSDSAGRVMAILRAVAGEGQEAGGK